MGISRTEGKDGGPAAAAVAGGSRTAVAEPSRPSVPLLDLNIQNLVLESELKAAFERILHSGRFILGPEVEKLETTIASMIGVRHAIGVSSGTDAILLALMTLGIGPGDEVVCPTFTFFATAGCVARVGATPVFVDSCPVCFNLSVADLARKMSPRTRAVLPVHLFGQASDLDGVLETTRARGIAVIEDAAQSLGAQYRKRSVGGFDAFGIFSFFPSKNLGGFGDGGLVVTNDDALAEKARSLRTHGAKPKYYHKYIGGNFRLDPLQAALLSVKLPHYDGYTEGRRSNAGYYTQKLSGLPGVFLRSRPGDRCQDGPSADLPPATRLVLPTLHAERSHIWNQYTLRVIGDGQRDVLRSMLSRAGVGTEIYYPVPLHRQECFAYLPSAKERLEVAESLSKECLSVPIYPELTRLQQDRVIEVISDFLRGER